ncbi:hypothetical protein, partial [Stenotrophomonas chelatiphaga]
MRSTRAVIKVKKGVDESCRISTIRSLAATQRFLRKSAETARHHRRTIYSNEGVDGLKKSGIIGGSQRRNAFGPDVEAAESTTLRYGETALKKGVDEA